MEAFDLKGKGFAIDPASIAGVRYTSVADVAPAENGCFVLFHGDDEPGGNEAARSGTVHHDGSAAGNGKSGDFYLARYDLDGRQVTFHKLDLSFVPVRMAVLPGDRILMTGFDWAESKAVLMTMQSDGSGVRPVDDKKLFPEAEDLAKSSTLKMEKDAPEDIKKLSMYDGIAHFQFGYAGDGIVLIKSGAGEPAMWSMRGADVRLTKL